MADPTETSLMDGHKSMSHDTTQAETRIGISAIEESGLNNTTLFNIGSSVIISRPPRFENPSDEMRRRWKDIIEKSLPAIDLIDLSAEHN